MARAFFLVERRIWSARMVPALAAGCTDISKGNNLSVIVKAFNVLIGVQILK